jgi:hypothetical protein
VNVPVNPIIEFILKTIFRFILKNCFHSTHLNRVHIEEMIPKMLIMIMIIEVVEVEALGYLKRH